MFVVLFYRPMKAADLYSSHVHQVAATHPDSQLFIKQILHQIFSDFICLGSRHMWPVTNQPSFCLKGANAYARSISNFTTSGVQRLGHNAVSGNEMQKWWLNMICAHGSFTAQKRVLNELKPAEWQRQRVKAVSGGDRDRESKRKWTLLKTFES